MGLFSVILIGCFASPLYALAKFALHSALYSHILLVPFISLYLVWIKRADLPRDSRRSFGAAAFLLIGGLSVLAGYWSAAHQGWKPATADYLAAMMLSFLFMLAAGAFALLGTATMRAITFPAVFLVFAVPFPDVLRQGIESLLQHGSAEAAFGLFRLSGMPVFQQGTAFQLPGFSMEVAPECSGIHSSLVLFITSLLAGHLLLRAGWSRALLVLAVIPLAVLRNGFRIFTLGQLCVRLNPNWINSDLHHRGGPVFFAVFLVPFFLLLWLLRRLEQRRTKI